VRNWRSTFHQQSTFIKIGCMLILLMFLITYYDFKNSYFSHLGGKNDVLVDSCGMCVFSGRGKRGRCILFGRLSNKMREGKGLLSNENYT